MSDDFTKEYSIEEIMYYYVCGLYICRLYGICEPERREEYEKMESDEILMLMMGFIYFKPLEITSMYI